ncbi:heat shock protein 67B1 [Penaeus vannamei]|uniref:heat shock protein 67B1 n=1 Tax=Penaeus vannamei TaxID=6689 RepID=UPI00387F6986
MVGTKTTKTVTVERRGAFSDDPFFKDSLDEWDQAMKNVVDRWDKQPVTTTTTTTTSPSSSETRTVYRQIRSSNVTSDDSQAVSCTEEDGKYKMIIDVKDFKPEDINVKTVDDTVVVEGKIEKKEGNAVSTQMFTRRFMLPSNVDLNAITSALSRDGVLTINAPKLATQGAKGRLTAPSGKNGTTTVTTSTINPLAFGPSIAKTAGNDKRYLNHTPLHDEPPSQTTTVVRTEVDRGSRDHWTSFNDMVEKSQREMEDMMRRHTLNSSLDAPTSPPSVSTNLTISTQPSARPPAGVATNRDVVKSGNNVTEREEQRWDDNPAPGLTRHNRVLNEKTAMKGADGSVIGNKERMEKESHAEGSNEEVLPDGTKRKTFTKSYETRKVYSFNSGDPKAV